MSKYTLVLIFALFGFISCQNECGVKYCVTCDTHANKCIECRGGWYLGSDGQCHA